MNRHLLHCEFSMEMGGAAFMVGTGPRDSWMVDVISGAGSQDTFGCRSLLTRLTLRMSAQDERAWPGCSRSSKKVALSGASLCRRATGS